jgi:hypothetical protein
MRFFDLRRDGCVDREHNKSINALDHHVLDVIGLLRHRVRGDEIERDVRVLSMPIRHGLLGPEYRSRDVSMIRRRHRISDANRFLCGLPCSLHYEYCGKDQRGKKDTKRLLHACSS